MSIIGSYTNRMRSERQRAGSDMTESSTTTVNTDKRERAVLRLHRDMKQRAEYWAQKRGYSSVNEYMADAVDEKIRRENLDYDLPTLEIARLNQVVDELRALSTNQANLERVITTGFDSLLGLTRGDSYLLDPEDGEL
ncbi:hypothetical protein AHiyo1_49770 [Arthrobacter sp. Hiyo1]|nr:hypothetical protein AHiyo1_49770 [Arthrobacter sp. Hiyo1]